MGVGVESEVEEEAGSAPKKEAKTKARQIQINNPTTHTKKHPL